jgi:3-phosphoshikimate 1-carboxyvinyltransferase
MHVLLEKKATTTKLATTKLFITGSKSETNRLLILQALFPELTIENESNSDDSDVMTKAILQVRNNPNSLQVLDIHHAGTAMRFLTAYFASQIGTEVILTGSPRMKERPVEILVNALRTVGAKIEYLENEGFPPLKIIGTKLEKNTIFMPANVSSQYISALLLIAPKLQNGLILTLEGEITSRPYIEMTLELLKEIGAETKYDGNKIIINTLQQIKAKKITVESDWSSASYWYSVVALSNIGTKIVLSSYKKNSRQGDAVLSEIYKNFGVSTTFHSDESITISKVKSIEIQSFSYDFIKTPDIAQTIVVTCFGLKISCHLTGLHTLKIKETDRLLAIQNEIAKLGGCLTTNENSLFLENAKIINSNCTIRTYEDHRMAMAFAPLALLVPIKIENAAVVSKSYPDFWNDFKEVACLEEIK